MLTNQATRLVNQARNLANLPMSTLTQLQSSIAQTQSLLGQAQNIAFNVQRIEQAYSTSYGSAAGTGSTTAMVANAQTRWQNSVAAFEDSLKVQAGVVGNIPTNSSAMTSLVTASQSATGALAGGAGRQPASGAAIPAALRPGGGAVRQGPGRCAGAGAQRRRRSAGPAELQDLLDAHRLSARQRHHVQRQLRRGDAGTVGNLPRRRDRRPDRGRHHGSRGDQPASTRPPLPRPLRPSSHQHPTTSRPSCAVAARSVPRMPKIRIASRSGRRTASASSAGRRGRCRHKRPQALPRRPPLLREMRDEQRRRHRHLPQHLHHLHRFRLRPDQGRSRLSLVHADRHRHHAGRPVLGLGRRRGHPPAPGEEDPLHRLLRLHHQQLQQSLGHRLQQLRRPRPEGGRLVDLAPPTSCSRASSPRSGSTPASRCSTRPTR